MKGPVKKSDRPPVGPGLGRALFLLFAVLLILFSAFPQAVLAEMMSVGFDPGTPLPAVYVTGTLHPSEFYSRNSNLALEIPGAARLMTLYLAVERLPVDDLVPISHLAERYDRAERLEGGFDLKAGDSLPLRFLLLKMLFQDSDAAALAIAERVSGSREGFLEEMEKTADVLGMYRTKFYACDVARAERESVVPLEIEEALDAYDSFVKDNGTDSLELPEAGLAVSTVKTTLRDVARLMTALLGNARARALLSVSEELVQVTGSDGKGQVVSLRSPASHFVTLSENRITASFLHLSDRYSLLCSAGTSPGQVPAQMVTASLRQSSLTQPTLQIYRSLDDHFTRSPLTRGGERYPGAPEKAANGELFDLIYLESVDYVHPLTDHFLEQTLDYLGNAPYPLPVQKGVMTGQVVFTLRDQIQIPVPVGSDRDILADHGLLKRGISQLIQNPNLAATIAGLVLVLCAGFLVIIIRESIRLRYWIRLGRMELNAREARAIMFGDKTSPGKRPKK